jgi:hypothetical protein
MAGELSPQYAPIIELSSETPGVLFVVPEGEYNYVDIIRSAGLAGHEKLVMVAGHTDLQEFEQAISYALSPLYAMLLG